MSAATVNVTLISVCLAHRIRIQRVLLATIACNERGSSFCEKYLVRLARPHCVQEKHFNETLKIDLLGLNWHFSRLQSQWLSGHFPHYWLLKDVTVLGLLCRARAAKGSSENPRPQVFNGSITPAENVPRAFGLGTLTLRDKILRCPLLRSSTV